MSAMSNNQYWKNTIGFNIYTQDDPDFLSWLFEQWKATYKEDPNQTFSKLPIIEEFVNFGRNLISQKPVVAVEYIDTGLAVLLSTGEKIPFNKSTTINEPNIAINVMGPTEALARPRVDQQIDTSFSITGGR